MTVNLGATSPSHLSRLSHLPDLPQLTRHMRHVRPQPPQCPSRPMRTAHPLRRALVLTASATALLSLTPSAFASPAAAGIRAETLVQSSSAWDGTGYTAYSPGRPQPTLVRITLAPNTRLDWHTHPMPAIGYVTAGHLTVERADNGKQQAFSAGQTLTELVDVAHRGWSGSAGAELLVFYARTERQPLSLPAGGADNSAQASVPTAPSVQPARPVPPAADAARTAQE